MEGVQGYFILYDAIFYYVSVISMPWSPGTELSLDNAIYVCEKL